MAAKSISGIIYIPNLYLCKNDYWKNNWSNDHMNFEVRLPKNIEFFLKILENKNLFQILG